MIPSNYKIKVLARHNYIYIKYIIIIHLYIIIYKTKAEKYKFVNNKKMLQNILFLMVHRYYYNKMFSEQTY